MIASKDTWTRVHDLALVYLALAYGTDEVLADEELATIMSTMRAWRSDLGQRELEEVVMEAMAVLLDAEDGRAVADAISRLQKNLSRDEKKQALADVVKIAEADGILLGSERSMISILANSWDVKRTKSDLMERSNVSVEDHPFWSLMHDLGLIYLVVAHSSDNELADAEIAAIIERMSQWQPELQEGGVRKVLREALAFYSTSPDRESLQESVASIKDSFPPIQRLAVLDDLMFIAASDGHVNEHEKDIISSLARAWEVEVRMNESDA